MKLRAIIISGLTGFSLGTSSFANAPDFRIDPGADESVTLSVSNLFSGGTYYVEHTENLVSNVWEEVISFEGWSGNTNWMTKSADTGFYRISREEYHSKVGQIASLNEPGLHDVSGSAQIINNRTVELRNFNFDGGGIAVEIWVSPNPSFVPHTAISGDLFGTAFTNSTLHLDLPPGTDLDEVNYISVWCLAAGVSFGDGPFQ